MRRWENRFWLLTLSTLLLRLFVAAHLPLSPDETYYWLWSRHFDVGYFDHPPMVAWLIAASTWLLGNTELGVRAGASFAMAIGGWLLFSMARKEASTKSAFLLALGFHLVPLFNLGGIIITPDTPLLLFWLIAMVLAMRVYRTGATGDWMALGVAIGLGLLSKLTMLLFFLALYLAWRKRPKDEWWQGMMLAVAISLATCLPMLVWMARHDWMPIVFQFSHGTAGTGVWWQNLPVFLLAQIALFSPGLFWLAIVGLRNAAWRKNKYSTIDIRPFSWLPLASFIPFAAFSHAEAGWAAVAYPAALILAWRVGLGELSQDGRRFSQALAIAGMLSLILYGWAFGLLGKNPQLDPGRDMARESRAVASRLSEAQRYLPVVAHNYRTASLYAFYGRRQGETPGVLGYPGDRKSQFDLWPKPDLADGFIWIADAAATRPPAVADSAPLDCAWASERFPDLGPMRFAFLICEPEVDHPF